MDFIFVALDKLADISPEAITYFARVCMCFLGGMTAMSAVVSDPSVPGLVQNSFVMGLCLSVALHAAADAQTWPFYE